MSTNTSQTSENFSRNRLGEAESLKAAVEAKVPKGSKVRTFVKDGKVWVAVQPPLLKP